MKLALVAYLVETPFNCICNLDHGMPRQKFSDLTGREDSAQLLAVGCLIDCRAEGGGIRVDVKGATVMG